MLCPCAWIWFVCIQGVACFLWLSRDCLRRWIFPLQLASPGFAMTLYCSGSFSLSSESSTMSSLVVAVELPFLISCYSNSDFVLSRWQVLGEAEA